MRETSSPSSRKQAAAARARLTEIIKASENAFMERILAYAWQQGFTDYTSTRIEDWRASVRGLSQSFLAALNTDRSLELRPDETYADDPLVAFGITEARQHRSRGVDMAMFLGLLKYYRQAYHDVAQEAAGATDAKLVRSLTNRLFDRVEIALATDWAKEGLDARIAALNQANRHLTHEKTRYLSIFEGISTPVLIFDAQLRLLNCNLAAAPLLGDAEASRDGKGMADPGRDQPIARVAPWLAEDVTEFLESGEQQRRIETAKPVLGAVRVYQVSFSRMQTASELEPYIVVEINDISSLRLQEQEAREGRTLLQRILNAISAGILVVDPADLSILYCNDHAAEITGRERVALLGGSFADIEFLSLRNDPIPTRQLLDAPEAHEERRLRRPDGTIIPILATSLTAPLHGQLKLVKVLFDVSRQKEMERMLMQSQKLESIGQLAAGIAHEINTPVQYVGGNVEFLENAFAAYEEALEALTQSLESTQAEPQVRQTLDTVRERLAMFRAEVPLAITQTKEGVARVTSIVQGIRRFSHPGGEARKPSDLNKALQATLEVSRNEWKHVAETELDLDPDLPLVWCSAGDINQVFLNLVVNASHAIADKVREQGGKGRITIATRLVGSRVMISICDTGTGIKLAHQGQVFNPFFTTKAPGKGTGQGLAIVHAIIDKHDGTINFASTPGEGTCFVIHLPVGEPCAKETP